VQDSIPYYVFYLPKQVNVVYEIKVEGDVRKDPRAIESYRLTKLNSVSFCKQADHYDMFGIPVNSRDFKGKFVWREDRQLICRGTLIAKLDNQSKKSKEFLISFMPESK
jgi:hypothetical protein